YRRFRRAGLSRRRRRAGSDRCGELVDRPGFERRLRRANRRHAARALPRVAARASGKNGLAARSPSPTPILPDRGRRGAPVSGNRRILRRQFLDIADLDVGRHYARPLGAGAKEPSAPPHHPRGMKRVAGDEELFPAAQVRPDDDAVARAVVAQPSVRHAPLWLHEIQGIRWFPAFVGSSLQVSPWPAPSVSKATAMPTTVPGGSRSSKGSSPKKASTSSITRTIPKAPRAVSRSLLIVG